MEEVIRLKFLEIIVTENFISICENIVNQCVTYVECRAVVRTGLDIEERMKVDRS